MKRIIAFLCVICITLTFAGCDSLEQTSASRVYYTDEHGEEYYNINDNYFTFEGYNVLEVIVNDSEKFILYDYEKDQGETGYGEWIKDGVSYPIDFIDSTCNYPGGRHGNIVISKEEGVSYSSGEYRRKYDFWEDDIHDKTPPVFAMINNDQENPGLYRWSDGAYPYNWEFEKTKVSVQYKTYTREDLHDRVYIPEKLAQFYSSNTDNTSFSLNGLDLSFNGKTGEGVWKLNGVDIPIIASFNQDEFTLSVRYNTKDEREGLEIFLAEGTSVNDIKDNCATFILKSFPKNCGYENKTTQIIQKN